MPREESRALRQLRTRLLAFADEPTLANFERYRVASRYLDAVRALDQPVAERRAAQRKVGWAA